MKTFTLELRGAVALDGVLRRAGELVEVDEAVAKNLLYRGKAVTPESREAPTETTQTEAGGSDDKKPSDGLNVAQLKEALTAKGVAIPENAKKADLAALLDATPAA